MIMMKNKQKKLTKKYTKRIKKIKKELEEIKKRKENIIVHEVLKSIDSLVKEKKTGEKNRKKLKIPEKVIAEFWEYYD